MGLQLLMWAWEQKVGDPSRKLLLVKLAESANDESGETWWNIKYFAVKCELSVRTVQRHLATLKRMGLLETEERKRKDGSQASNIYRFTPVDAYFERRVNPPGVTGDTPPLTPVTSPPVTDDTRGRHPRHPGASPVSPHEPEKIPKGSVIEGKGGGAPPAFRLALSPEMALKALLTWLEGERESRTERSAVPGSDPVRYVTRNVVIEQPRPPLEVLDMFNTLGGSKRVHTWVRRPEDRNHFIDSFLKAWRNKDGRKVS